MINLNLLRTFQDLTVTLSFTRTADRLGIAQPAVSRQIQELERSLGVALFLRDQKRVILTQEGQTLAQTVLPRLAEMEDQIERTIRGATAVRGTIRIMAPRELGEFFFFQTAPEFMKAYPEVELRLELGSVNSIAQAVLENRTDVAVTLEPLIQQNLMSFRLMEQNIYCLTHPSSPGFEIKRLRDYIFLKYSEQDALLRLFIEKRIPPRYRSALRTPLTVNSHACLVEFLKTSGPHAYAILPSYSPQVEAALIKKEVKIVEALTLPTEIFLSLRDVQPEPRRIRILRRFIQDKAKDFIEQNSAKGPGS